MTQQEEVVQLRAQTSRLIEQAGALLSMADDTLRQGEPVLSVLGLPSDPSRIEAAMRSEFSDQQIAEMKERIQREMAQADPSPAPDGQVLYPSESPSRLAARSRRHHRTV